MSDTVIVQINRRKFFVEPRTWTRAELSALLDDPIPDDYDIWRIVPGAPDERVGETVEAFNGLRLFTASRFINSSRGVS